MKKIIFAALGNLCDDNHVINPAKVEKLNKITDATGADIVITGTWAKLAMRREISFGTLEVMVRTLGITAAVSGYTDDSLLYAHKNNLTKYAILIDVDKWPDYVAALGNKSYDQMLESLDTALKQANGNCAVAIIEGKSAKEFLEHLAPNGIRFHYEPSKVVGPG